MLKKFGDVVWHVNWSVTGNILVLSVLWRRQGEVCIFLNDVLLIEAIFELTSLLCMLSNVTPLSFLSILPHVKQSNSRCWWGAFLP